MRIKQHFSLDLARGGVKPMAVAVQGEANTRVLVVSLFDKGAEWRAPAGTTAAVAFRKPDGKAGLYDTLPDGTPATVINGHTVEATLAPQALTTSGRVSVAIVFYDANLNTLATFPFWIIVEPNPAAGEQVSNNYYSCQNLDAVNKAMDDLTARVEYLEKHGGGGSSTGTLPDLQPDQILTLRTDETLQLKDGILSVNTTHSVEQDNTLPITSAGVYTAVGNIEALLKTI